MTIGHQLGLRLFLEGVETPVIGASISIAADSPASASIQVIATDKVLSLLPRTVVHLFFFDFVDASYPISKEPTSTKTNVTDHEAESAATNERDAFNASYKLLFMGEVQGLAFQKSSGSRAVVLQCVDFSNYWDTTYQYNFGGSLLGGRQHAAFIGANTNLFNSPLGHGVGQISGMLGSKSVNYPDLKGLLAGVVRCLEAIGGCYYGDTTFKGASPFTSIAELRLKILQQITAAEDDTSTAKLFARKTFNAWMNRSMGSLGKLVTFRGIVQILQQFVYHNIFPCPVAKYQKKQTGIKKTKTWATDLSEDPRARNFIEEIKKLRKLMMSARSNLNNYPAVIADQGVIKFYQTTAKAVTSSETVMGLKNDLDASRKLCDDLTLVGVPNIAGLSQIFQTITQNRSGADRMLGWGRSPSALGDMSTRTTAGGLLDMAVAGCDTILQVRVKHSKTYTLNKLDRVNNQILRPDIWFVPAPRCNVLFPELYQSFQWSRNFMREVSRIELQTSNEILGDNALFNGHYYAPDVADMRSGKRLSSRQFGSLIMSHELLTGIIPMYEKLNEANIFAMKGQQVSTQGAKVGYAQRAVNHQYFKHRFASRQMAAEGRFNPWFVAGDHV